MPVLKYYSLCSLRAMMCCVSLLWAQGLELTDQPASGCVALGIVDYIALAGLWVKMSCEICGMPFRPIELNVLPDCLAYMLITKGCSLLLCLTQMRCLNDLLNRNAWNRHLQLLEKISPNTSENLKLASVCVHWTVKYTSVKCCPEIFIIPEADKNIHIQTTCV